MMTETQNELAQHIEWATGEAGRAEHAEFFQDRDAREPDQAPEEAWADLSIEERNMWLDEYRSEQEAWAREPDPRPYRWQ